MKKKNNKKKSIIKTLLYVLGSIIILELIIMGIMYFKRELNIDYQDNIVDLIKLDKGYIGIGSSNFRDSEYVNKKIYTYLDSNTKKEENILANQARLVSYDKDFHIIWEKTFACKYDSNFYSIIKDDDAYIVVGSYIKDENQISLNTREGLIVKYSLDGKMLWYKDYQVLGDTEFFKVIKSGEDYIVVGQSIYENMEIGNHYNGGGIIVKYSKDGELLAKNNYGGNKSGLFNDIKEVSDGYIVCGKDATNYGIVVKFKKDFNRLDNDEKLVSNKVMWHHSHSYTDTVGFTSMEIKNNKIYLTGSINVSDKKDDNGKLIYQYDAGIVIYDMKGKYLDKYTFGGESLDRFNSIIMEDEYMIVVGGTASSDIDISNYPKYTSQTGIIVKYDYNGKILNKTYYGGEKSDLLAKIIKNDDDYLVIGSSNSKKTSLGYDYQTIIKSINKNLEIAS